MKRRNFLRTISTLIVAAHIYPVVGWGVGAEGDDFDKLPESQRLEVKRNWDRFKGFSPERKAQVLEAFQKIEALDSAGTKKLEANYKIWKALSPDEQAAVRKKYVSWSSMDEAKKQKLRDRLKGLDSMGDQDRAKLLDTLRKSDSSKKAGDAK